jgi:APA family basic amino acid/polyamine antiporter
MRIKQPGVPRPFRVPLVPVVSSLGVLVCGAMIISLDKVTQLTAFAWMLIGLVIYFSYSRSRSKYKGPHDMFPKASNFENK